MIVKNPSKMNSIAVIENLKAQDLMACVVIHIDAYLFLVDPLKE